MNVLSIGLTHNTHTSTHILSTEPNLHSGLTCTLLVPLPLRVRRVHVCMMSL